MGEGMGAAVSFADIDARHGDAGIEELKEAVDTLIIIPNQKLLSFIEKQTRGILR